MRFNSATAGKLLSSGMIMYVRPLVMNDLSVFHPVFNSIYYHLSPRKTTACFY